MDNRGMSVIPLIVLFVIVGAAVFLIFNSSETDPNGSTMTPTPTLAAGSDAESTAPSSIEYEFASEKKSAHFISSIPKHGSTMVGDPAGVQIIVNYDLVEDSTISIFKEGTEEAFEVGAGKVLISSDNRSMVREMSSDAGTGLFLVKYSACWTDNTCHDGSFEFAVE